MHVTPEWVPYPDNYADDVIRVTGDVDNGFVVEPISASCKVHLRVKVKDVLTRLELFVDKDTFGSHVIGICGNCNDIDDDYESLEDSGRLDDPIRIAMPLDDFSFIPN